MPRRRKAQPIKKDWRWYASLTLNLFVVLAFIVGGGGVLTGLLGGPPQRSAVFPTDFPLVDIPTLAPTVGAPLTTVVPPSPQPAQTPSATPTAKP